MRFFEGEGGVTAGGGGGGGGGEGGGRGRGGREMVDCVGVLAEGEVQGCGEEEEGEEVLLGLFLLVLGVGRLWCWW